MRMRSRLFWACFYRPTCLFLSQDLATLLVPSVYPCGHNTLKCTLILKWAKKYNLNSIPKGSLVAYFTV